MFRLPLRLSLVALFSLVWVLPTFAQNETYTSPDGAFSVPVPEGWTVEEQETLAIFTSPEGVLTYWLAVPAENADDGALAALEIVAPDFVGMPIQRDEFPGNGGVWIQQIYLSEGKPAVTLSFHVGDTAYVAWVPPVSQDSLVAVSPALNGMLVNFTFAGQVDLTDAQSIALDEEALDDLNAYIADALVRYEIPGASVAVVQNGQPIFTGAYGVTNNETETPVTDETLFMIGSVTKSMTSALMATLVDDGTIDWDTPVTDIYPDFALSDPDRAAMVTMGDLLSMSTGVARYDLPLFLESQSEADLLADLATFPVVSGYHEGYNYSNHMVTAGGFLAAMATGAALDESADTYAELLQTRLFDPLGMTSTTINFHTALDSGLAASPHSQDWFADTFEPNDYAFEHFVIPVAPAGAVWSTAGDMAKYLVMQLENGTAADGTAVVSAENLGVTHTPVIDLGNGAGYAMGWVTASYAGQPFITHDGGTTGFSSDVALFPAADLGIVVLTNRSGGTAFMNAVRDYTIELAFGLEHRSDAVNLIAEQTTQAAAGQLRDRASMTQTPPDPEIVAPYLGSYERGVTIALADDGTLTATGAYGDIPLYLAGEQTGDTFVTGGSVSGIRVLFGEDEDGNVTATLLSLLEIGTPGEQYSLVLHKLDA